jgi:hypothetical protein
MITTPPGDELESRVSSTAPYANKTQTTTFSVDTYCDNQSLLTLKADDVVSPSFSTLLYAVMLLPPPRTKL